MIFFFFFFFVCFFVFFCFFLVLNACQPPPIPISPKREKPRFSAGKKAPRGGRQGGGGETPRVSFQKKNRGAGGAGGTILALNYKKNKKKLLISKTKKKPTRGWVLFFFFFLGGHYKTGLWVFGPGAGGGRFWGGRDPVREKKKLDFLGKKNKGGGGRGAGATSAGRIFFFFSWAGLLPPGYFFRARNPTPPFFFLARGIHQIPGPGFRGLWGIFERPKLFFIPEGLPLGGPTPILRARQENGRMGQRRRPSIKKFFFSGANSFPGFGDFLTVSPMNLAGGAPAGSPFENLFSGTKLDHFYPRPNPVSSSHGSGRQPARDLRLHCGGLQSRGDLQNTRAFFFFFAEHQFGGGVGGAESPGPLVGESKKPGRNWGALRDGLPISPRGGPVGGPGAMARLGAYFLRGFLPGIRAGGRGSGLGGGPIRPGKT